MYKEAAEAPPLPYTSVVTGTYSQGPTLPVANTDIGADFLCRTTYKDFDQMTYKQVAQAPPLSCDTVVICNYTQYSCIQSKPSMVLVRVRI
jgi:hypothetical protein